MSCLSSILKQLIPKLTEYFDSWTEYCYLGAAGDTGSAGGNLILEKLENIPQTPDNLRAGQKTLRLLEEVHRKLYKIITSRQCVPFIKNMSNVTKNN